MPTQKVKIQIDPAADVELLMVEDQTRTDEITPTGEQWVFEEDVEDVGEVGYIWFHLLAVGQKGISSKVQVWVNDVEKTLIDPEKKYNGKGRVFYDEEIII